MVPNQIEIINHTRFLVILLISLPCLIFATVCGSKQKALYDLRRFKVVGWGGRFIVNRNALEQLLQYRKQHDASCGKDVKLQLPQSLPHSSYNVSQQGEVTLFYVTVTDHTLADELPNSLKHQVATSYQHLLVALPVIVGTNEEHVLLHIQLFTNTTKKVLVPYTTSNREVTHVESIEEDDDGRVTLRLGSDVMTFQVINEVKEDDGKNVAKDFEKVHGKAFTSYPSSFDWGCEFFGSRISFCQVLNEVWCELAVFGGDVCTVSSTSSSERSPTSMTVTKMTGTFRDMFPYLAETVPSESFEAETITREHATGIKYPCLTV
ncbi:hypothetical protein HOLleu_13817 [Holothuria leucospilota]|uniref:Uncharacterized protein n=1 Tax=Holothuria leucospilota TaxID=206669 RepID=A0A9Q1C5M5_HOLLE|nr:hypothetical protein HOLleu_13817 [Holothuria leucospilota]